MELIRFNSGSMSSDWLTLTINYVLKMAYNHLRLFPSQKSPRSHLLSEHGVIEDQEVEEAAKADARWPGLDRGRPRGPPDHQR
jgi:hypothetical protein